MHCNNNAFAFINIFIAFCWSFCYFFLNFIGSILISNWKINLFVSDSRFFYSTKKHKHNGNRDRLELAGTFSGRIEFGANQRWLLCNKLWYFLDNNIDIKSSVQYFFDNIFGLFVLSTQSNWLCCVDIVLFHHSIDNNNVFANKYVSDLLLFIICDAWYFEEISTIKKIVFFFRYLEDRRKEANDTDENNTVMGVICFVVICPILLR